MRSPPRNPESQPTAPDCTYLVTLEQRQAKNHELEQAMTQKLLPGKTKSL
jgi:hypothetical protein